ncbi:MAG: ATP-binding cassette domain-containing protein [Candidatus Babeliales bacterium]
MLPHNVTLKVHNLSVTLDEQTILDTLNFTVSKHDVVIILGANGSGKSTLLKALMGLVPFQGSVEWSTRHIGYLPPQEEITRTNLPPLTVHRA